MIYLLEFTGTLYEFKNSQGKPSLILRHLTKMFPDIMILHRYDIFFYYERKFQTNNPDKIELTRLDGKNAILYHLDIYSGCPEKIVDLIKHCVENNIDLFVPVSDGFMHRYLIDDTSVNPHRYNIREILERYEHVLYDFKKDFDLAKKEMIRDLNLRKLFD
jgi:hypothetical protein